MLFAMVGASLVFVRDVEENGRGVEGANKDRHALCRTNAEDSMQ